MMQVMWISGLDWNDNLPEEMTPYLNKAMSWFSELSMLTKIKVPRCLQLSGKVESISLHVFADASQDAYGAVVYVRSELNDRRMSVSFVTSKTKV